MAPPRKKQRKSDARSEGEVNGAIPSTPPAPAGPETSEVAKAANAADNVPSGVSEKAGDQTTVKASTGEAKARKTLFVRSLPPSTTTENLTELFSRSHPVRHATAVLDPETGACRGYGFVTFVDTEDAASARDEFHAYTLAEGELGIEADTDVAGEDDGAKFKRRRLRVDVAEPRKRVATSKFAADGTELEDTIDTIDAAKGVKRKRAGAEAGEQDRLTRDLETGSKVIVRNLPWSIKSGEQLGKYFEKWGKLKGAVVPKKNGGLLQGFGFITFKSRKAAERAIKEGNGLEVDGRPVAVDWSVQRDAWRETQEQAQPDADEGVGDSESDGAGSQEDSGADVDQDFSEASGDDEDNLREQDDDDDKEVEHENDEDDEDDEEDELEDRSGTLFIRNLPFTCTDEDLEDAFRAFGAVRYARVVMDQATERSRGTGFVCFYSADDAEACLRSAPRHTAGSNGSDKKTSQSTPLSVLQDETLDLTGNYTIDGRVLQVSRAVDKREASRLTAQGAASRLDRDKDRRRLYLLSEGTINSRSPLWQRLSPTERQLREASAKQRRSIIESNPSLQVSLTRLSIRNVPRSITSKDLKQLAREAVVGFAKDVKEGKRQRLSKEEISRGGDDMREAERERKDKRQGVVRQAKIVFEGREGAKIDEKTGAGRSRGYGFIEYHTHRNALMALRWLNGHLLDYKAMQSIKAKGEKAKVEMEDRKKRLIVEFAIENRQVVMRRKEREDKARERGHKSGEGEDADEKNGTKHGKGGGSRKGRNDPRNASKKRKRTVEDPAKEQEDDKPADEKLAKRQRIIQKKRMMRRAKRQGKPWKT